MAIHNRPPYIDSSMNSSLFFSIRGQERVRKRSHAERSRQRCDSRDFRELGSCRGVPSASGFGSDAAARSRDCACRADKRRKRLYAATANAVDTKARIRGVAKAYT
eukprot:3811227-Pleurochrysis_carterae.AAC.2